MWGRKIARGLILDVLGSFAEPQAGIHILNGHRIALKNPCEEIFHSQLRKLEKLVRFIRFEDAVELIISKVVVSEPLVAFSFDDGFEECHSMIAPVLEDFNINAAFFINPNFVSGNREYIDYFTNNVVKTPGKLPMSWEQIKDLHNRGHVIGAHTLDHYNINDDNIEELEHQIGECRTVVEQHIGVPCDYFAFPFGRLEHANSHSIDIAVRHYPYVFSQSDYKNYFSFGGRVINRRHFEPDWPIIHLNYFLNTERKY